MDKLRVILIIVYSLPFLEGYAMQDIPRSVDFLIDTAKEEIVVYDTADTVKYEIPSSAEITPDILQAEYEVDTAMVENSENENKTKREFNFELGFGNYLMGGKFPDATDQLFTLDPLGSSNLALVSNNSSHLFGSVFMDWGGSLSWYNFRFQDPKMRIVKEADQVVFYQDSTGFAKYRKSKLKVTYINAFIVPMIHVGKKSGNREAKGWSRAKRNSANFRLGAGP